MMTLFWMLACKPEKEKVETVIGSIEAEHLTDTGVELVDADVDAASAYGYSANGHVVVYISGKPGVDCVTAGSYLQGEITSPDQVLASHTCEVTLKIEDIYDPAGTVVVDDALAATVVLGCAMDDGEWVYEESQTGGAGYFYSGPWWQGYPDTSLENAFSIELSGGEGKNFDLNLEINTFRGGFTYESMNQVPTTGSVSGSLSVKWCDSIATAQIFPD